MLETITSVNGVVNGIVWGPVGLALLFGVRLGLKALFPATLLFNFLRYFLLLVIGMGIYPFLFKKLNF